MKVTKYPQSCLLLEGDEGRILVDPGVFAMDAYEPADFGTVDAVLYTHRHPDHFDARFTGAFVERGADLYANADVCEEIPEGATAVADGDDFSVGGFQITARDLAHVPLVDGSAGPPNTGYVVDDRLFHPGDGIEIDGVAVDLLALPITGPSISFRDAYRFTADIGAQTVVPMHYDMFSANPELFESFCDIARVVILDHGESAEL